MNDFALTSLTATFWGTAALAAAAVYAFFFRSTAVLYEKHYDYKLRMCEAAALAVAQIANTEDENVLKVALARLDELYYGQLVLFESRRLAEQMIAFRALFAEKDASFEIAKVQELRSNKKGEIRQAALRLASACRAEVRPTIFSLIYDRIFPVRQ